MFKYSKLLAFLLAPFFMMADDADAGGGAAEDRGDGGLAEGAPDSGAAAAAAVTDPLADDTGADALTPEEKAAADAAATAGAADADGKKKDSRIPLARHEQILNTARAERDALAAQLASYQKGAEVVAVNEQIAQTETQLLALEGEYNKLLADGEIEKATAKMTAIRQLERSIGEQKTQMVASAAEARAVERVRYDAVVERLETAYPSLNPDHEDFDNAKTAEVLELKAALEKQGATPSAALQKAVKYVIGAPTTGAQKNAVEVAPRVAAGDVAALRKQEALARNVAAAKSQPASTADVGLNSDAAGGVLTAETAMKMDQDAFAKLNEKDLARLRGDEL